MSEKVDKFTEHAKSPTLEEVMHKPRPKFAPDDLVRHAKGGNYLILGRVFIEATMQECYLYRGEDGCTWARPVEEMEDGRFTRYGCYPNVNGVVRGKLAELLDHLDGVPNDVKLCDELREVKARIDTINQAIEFDKFPPQWRISRMADCLEELTTIKGERDALLAANESLAKDAESYVLPQYGDEVAANHPITCLNPSPTFIVEEIEFFGGCLSVRGKETCWFGAHSVRLIKRAALAASASAKEGAREISYPAVDDVNRYPEALFRYADRIEKGMPYLRNTTIDKFCKDVVSDMREEAFKSIRNAQGSFAEAFMEDGNHKTAFNMLLEAAQYALRYLHPANSAIVRDKLRAAIDAALKDQQP